MSNKKKISLILGILLLLIFSFVLDAPEALEEQAVSHGYTGRTAMIVLGSLVMAICWWASNVFPDWVTAMSMQLVIVIFAKINFSLAFVGYSKSTLWLLVGAFILSAAITKVGLLKRISFFLMRLFPATYRGQVLAMMSVGVACSPLMPSSTAKCVLGSILAESSSTVLGYENHSAGRSGLFMASWSGFYLLAPMFLSASFFSYVILEVLPPEYNAVSWGKWLLIMIVWGILTFIGMFFACMILYKPKDEGSSSQAAASVSNSDLGAMKSSEKIVAVIMGLCLIFWILEPVTGISSSIVALTGGVLCFIFNILEKKEISTLIPWGFILLVGVVMNIGDIFINVGISDWILGVVEPLATQISNKYIFIIFVYIVGFLMRFIIASQTAVITLLTGLFAPISASVGVAPVLAGITVYVASTWMVKYQNPTFLAALEGMGETISHQDTLKGAFGYLVVSLAACVISIPYWQLLGLM